MESGRDGVEFVAGSSVRSAIVDRLGERAASTDDLLGGLEASTSAVYSSLGELEDRGYVCAHGDGPWELTGRGRLVADMVCQRKRCEGLFRETGEYLRTHDTEVLPRPWRLRMGELAAGTVDVIAATETKPHRIVEEITRRIERAEKASVVSPIYVASYAEAMPDTPDSQLLLDEGVVRLARETDSGPDDDYDRIDVRVADVDFALMITESELLLSLPTLDGEYDAQSELVAEHDGARTWGSDLFEWCWERAIPVERFGAASRA
jgi:predicted transcriptional regulator